MKKTLIIGYGNPDRQDDGVAWHVMAALAHQLHLHVPNSYDEPFHSTDESLEFIFQLQLLPDLGEKIASVDRVCFIDAHTGAIPEEVRGIELNPKYHRSPFTHHMSPDTCLEIARTIYGKCPRAFLVSVRGYEFGFTDSLSPKTAELIPGAVKK